MHKLEDMENLTEGRIEIGTSMEIWSLGSLHGYGVITIRLAHYGGEFGLWKIHVGLHSIVSLGLGLRSVLQLYTQSHLSASRQMKLYLSNSSPLLL